MTGPDMAAAETHAMVPISKGIVLCGAGIAAITSLFTVATLAAPASKPTRSLDEVERTFAAKAASIDRQYRDQITAARTERLNGLRSLLDRAMEKKDLETAIRLRDMIKSAEAEQKADAPANPEAKPRIDEVGTLEKTIRGTVWTWGEETIQFEADGAAMNATWTAQGLLTTWRAIDRHPYRVPALSCWE